jgi:prepilin-type N-terminal cleavage/methylation domain-containing protein
MPLLGFFIAKTRSTHGFTLMELLVCLGVLSLITSFAIPSWQRLQERSQVEATRDQLMNDLQAARIRAVQLGQALQLSRLQDCAWTTSAENDWSCGWQLVVKADQTALHTTQLPTALLVTFGKTFPLEISWRGDLGTVGERWVIKSRQSALDLAYTLCLNSASRLRWQSGESCS